MVMTLLVTIALVELIAMTLFAEVSFSAALVSDRKAKVDREGTAFMLFSAATYDQTLDLSIGGVDHATC